MEDEDLVVAGLDQVYMHNYVQTLVTVCFNFINRCDFDGPVSIDEELDAVVVEELPKILTEQEEELLSTRHFATDSNS